MIGSAWRCRRLKPGVYAMYSWFGLRKWLADRLMVLSLGTTNSLYSTLYLLPFLRRWARALERAEVLNGFAHRSRPADLGNECFVADLAVNRRSAIL